MCGKYISPHLIRYNERITINNVEITDDEMNGILKEIAPKVDIYNREHEVPVKEFEVVTTLALIYFARRKCDFVVLETGLGGMYDCTNIAEGLISIITSIGLDHVDILGKTIEEIAKQKAGIIKPNNDTITCYQEKVTDIIQKTCKEKNNTLHIVNERDITNYSFDEDYQIIDYCTNDKSTEKEHTDSGFNYESGSYKNININLKGKCQIYNAALVLECINVLKQKGYEIKDDAIRKGLSTVIHKARFETLEDNPKIIFDGGHNEGAINNLRTTIEMYYPNKQKVYILSSLKTKDYKTVVKILAEDKKRNILFYDRK